MLVSTRRCLLAALAGLIAAPAAAADDFPGKRPITLVVGFPAGGNADMSARTLAGQKVVKAAADGRTLFMASGSEIVIAAMVDPAVRYDGQTDVTPIGGNIELAFLMTPTALPCIEAGKAVPIGVTTAVRSRGSTPQALARTVGDEVKHVRAVAPASMNSSS